MAYILLIMLNLDRFYILKLSLRYKAPHLLQALINLTQFFIVEYQNTSLHSFKFSKLYIKHTNRQKLPHAFFVDLLCNIYFNNILKSPLDNTAKLLIHEFH